MPEQKKTEEQIRHDIRRKFNFSEDKEKERIDTAVEMEKDRFKAVQKKQELKAELKKPGKPEGKKEKDPEGENLGSEPNYSIKDHRALMDVPEDDIDDFLDIAKKFNLTPEEAKRNKDVQVILKNRAEERKTANATNTGGSKRGSSKSSGNSILSKAENKNELPESDGDMDAMIRAREDKKYGA